MCQVIMDQGNIWKSLEESKKELIWEDEDNLGDNDKRSAFKRESEQEVYKSEQVNHWSLWRCFFRVLWR